MILLVAMIGAIVLTLRQRVGRAPPVDLRSSLRAPAPRRSRCVKVPLGSGAARGGD